MELEKDQLIKLYTLMLKTRKLDILLVDGLKQGKLVGFYHSGQGEEAVGVGGCTFLREDDFIYAHHRGHGLSYIVAKGADPKGFLAEHYGSGCIDRASAVWVCYQPGDSGKYPDGAECST